MPLVSRLLCERAIHFKEQLRNVENPNLFHAVSASSARFALLDAEARLPNQGAHYHGGYANR
jgi:hypothetical protein